MRALALAFVLAVLGCETSADAVLPVEIVGPESLDPIGDTPGGELRILVEQEGLPTNLVLEPSVSSLADLATLEFASFGRPMRILVRYAPEDAAVQVGGTPWFFPGVAGLVRIPIGEVSTCQTLARTRLPTGRVEPAIWRLYGTRWIVFGGSTDTGGHTASAEFQPLWLTIDRDSTRVAQGVDATGVRDFDSALHETQIVELSPERAILLAATSGGGAVFLLRPTDALDDSDFDRVPLNDMVGHFGLGAGSALVDLGDGGAAIVGGGDAVTPSDSITWIREDGAPNGSNTLAHPRFRPSVVRVGSALLVAGGQLEGDPQVEIVVEGGDGVAVSSPTTVRERPVLVAPPVSSVSARGSALLFGGADDAGEPIATVHRITGCPSACVVTEDPTLTWQRPRLAPTVVPLDDATLVLGGEDALGAASAAVDRIAFVTTTDLVFEQERTLEEARARGAAVEVTQGIVLLLGGRSADGGALDSFEMCWPASLPSLD